MWENQQAWSIWVLLGAVYIFLILSIMFAVISVLWTLVLGGTQLRTGD
jgi:hypothetical protein